MAGGGHPAPVDGEDRRVLESYLGRAPSTPLVRVARPVLLSPEERSELTHWARGRGERADRARIILRATDGTTDSKIASEMGIGRASAARWRQRFLTARLQGLENAPRTTPTGRRGRLPTQAILRATLAGARADGGSVSTRRIARQFGVSHMSVQRLWEAYRIGPRSRQRQGAPEPARGGPDVAGIQLGPQGPSLVLATPSGTRLPESNAFPSNWDPELLGWGSGHSRTLAPTISGPEFRDRQRFWERIERSAESRFELWIISGTNALLEDARFDPWRLRHPRLHFPRQSEQEPWLSRVARALEPGPGTARRAAIPGDDPELSLILLRYLASYRECSPPYEWRASRDDLVTGNGKTRLRYALAVTAHSGFISPGGVLASMTAHEALDARSRGMAKNVLAKNLRIRKGESLLIDTWSGTLPYARAFVIEARRIGARPYLTVRDEAAYWAAVDELKPAELAGMSRPEAAALEHADCLISFFGPSDRARSHAVPRPKMLELCKYEDEWYAAVQKAGVRSVQLALGRASEPSAKMYGVDMAQWQDELVEGTLVDSQTMRKAGRRLAGILSRGKELEIRHANGTRLTLRLAGAKPLLEDGIARPLDGTGWGFPNLPSGAVRAALSGSVAQGSFRSNVASAVGISDGVGEFAGGHWTFAGGRLVRHSFERGQKLFTDRFQAARKGKGAPGSISIGLNPKVSMIPLMEDQGLGTVTLQIGQNDMLGGSNRCGWWAWLYLRGADLDVDGRSVVRDGKLS